MGALFHLHDDYDRFAIMFRAHMYMNFFAVYFLKFPFILGTSISTALQMFWQTESRTGIYRLRVGGLLHCIALGVLILTRGILVVL